MDEKLKGRLDAAAAAAAVALRFDRAPEYVKRAILVEQAIANETNKRFDEMRAARLEYENRLAEKIAERIRKKPGQKRAALTVKAAAKACGVTPRTVLRWEAGEGTPDAWPGRADAGRFAAWVRGYRSEQSFKKPQIERRGNMDNFPDKRRPAF
jgi:DNA-binding transcriptional regulator YiaG